TGTTLEARTWDVRTGRLMGAPVQIGGGLDPGQTFFGMRGLGTRGLLSPDGRTAVVTFRQGERLYDTVTGKAVGPLLTSERINLAPGVGQFPSITPLALHPLGHRGVRSGSGPASPRRQRPQPLRLWDLVSGKPIGSPMIVPFGTVTAE